MNYKSTIAITVEFRATLLLTKQRFEIHQLLSEANISRTNGESVSGEDVCALINYASTFCMYLVSLLFMVFIHDSA